MPYDLVNSFSDNFNHWANYNFNRCLNSNFHWWSLRMVTCTRGKYGLHVIHIVSFDSFCHQKCRLVNVSFDYVSNLWLVKCRLITFDFVMKQFYWETLSSHWYHKANRIDCRIHFLTNISSSCRWNSNYFSWVFEPFHRIFSLRV